MMHPNIVQRQATTQDYQSCVRALALGAEAGEVFKNALSSGECHLAVHDGHIVGLIALHRHFFQRPFIALLVVAESMRRRGIGMQLIKTVEKHVNAGQLFTSTNQSNLPAQALFQRAGFVRSGLIENLDPGDSEVIFYRNLTDFRRAPNAGG